MYYRNVMDAVGFGPTFPECKVAGFGQLTYAPIRLSINV